jgi:signal peptidase II
VSSGHAASASRPAPRWLAPTVVLGVVVLDQITKVWVVAALSDGPLSIIGNDVELRLTRNSGGAFSLFTNATILLAVVAVVLSIVLVRAVRRAQDLLSVLALSLVLGGALGNLRRSPAHRVSCAASGGLRPGRVVPELQRRDSAITIGAILLVILALRPVRASETDTDHPT